MDMIKAIFIYFHRADHACENAMIEIEDDHRNASGILLNGCVESLLYI